MNQLKTIIYNNTEVLKIEDAQVFYESLPEGQYILVQTLELAEKMLAARGINVALIKNFNS